MDNTDNVIPLHPGKASERIVKRGARALFKAVRFVTGEVHNVPGYINQSITDVREAWAESRPNA